MCQFSSHLFGIVLKEFLLVNDECKMLTWLIAKINNNFYVTSDYAYIATLKNFKYKIKFTEFVERSNII